MRHGLTWLFSAVLILALVVGCAAPPASAPVTTGTTAQKVEAPIKIGIIANGSSAMGKGGLASAQMAAEEINSSGGVLGRKIEIVTGDSQGQVPNAVAEYKRLVMTDKVVAVIAAEATEMVGAMQETGADLYKEYPHVCIAPATSGLILTDKVFDNYAKYKFFFRTFGDPNSRYLMGLGVARDVIKAMGVKKVAIVMDDLDWTKIYRDGYANPKTLAPSPYLLQLGNDVFKQDVTKGLPPLREMWKALGVEVVYETKVAINEKMFLPIFESIASSGADYIDGWGLAYIDSITMTKQWSQSAAKDIPLLISGGAIQLPGAWSATGGSLLGLLLCMPSTEYQLTDRTVPYMKNIMKKTGTGGTWMGQGAYDNVYVLVDGIKAAGGTSDVEKLIKAMETTETVATTGNVKFQPASHQALIGYPYYTAPLAQWQGENNAVILYPFELSKINNAGKNYIPPAELRAKVQK
jgi:branched-chain amino acid transport system substrate-binding protein